MRRGIIVVLVGILVLIGIGVAYYRLRATREAERHVSPEFRKAARYALDLIESNDGLVNDVSEGDITKAMAMVDSAQTNKADGQVLLVLGEYKYRRAIYFSHHRADSDRPLLVACGNAAHWLIEDQAEVTHEATQPCLVELRKQVQELQKQYQSPGR